MHLYNWFRETEFKNLSQKSSKLDIYRYMNRTRIKSISRLYKGKKEKVECTSVKKMDYYALFCTLSLISFVH